MTEKYTVAFKNFRKRRFLDKKCNVISENYQKDEDRVLYYELEKHNGIALTIWSECWDEYNDVFSIALTFDDVNCLKREIPSYTSLHNDEHWSRNDVSFYPSFCVQGPKADDAECHFALYFKKGDESLETDVINHFFSSDLVAPVVQNFVYYKRWLVFKNAKERKEQQDKNSLLESHYKEMYDGNVYFIQFFPTGLSNIWRELGCHYELRFEKEEKVFVEFHCENGNVGKIFKEFESEPSNLKRDNLKWVKWGEYENHVKLEYKSFAINSNDPTQMTFEQCVEKAIDSMVEFVESYGNDIKEFVNKSREKMTNEELKEKYKDDIAFLENNHNIILHGAPGTGKTFMAKEIAKAMNAEYKVVQFHQSYDYTDFVEGLRPSGVGSKADFFERQDGVFKIFCKRALNSSKNGNFEESLEKLLKKIDECGTDYLEIPSQSSSFFVNFLNGKTIRFAPKITWEKNPEEFPYTINIDLMKNMYFGMVERFTNYSYARTLLTYMKDNFGLKDPNQKQAEKYVFIIDEINRGEMSKIFGELFLALEPSYRGENGRVDTQYQNLIENNDVFANGFYVPKNVYIIGTMNDIDRSVESMDFAMRRRFAFKEVTAEESMSMLDSEGAWKGNDESGVMPPSSVLVDLKARMAALNKEIAKPEYNLGDAYQIGAAYFLKFGLYFKKSTKEGDEAKADDAFEKLRKYHLEGLLREYLRGMDPKGDLLKKLLGAYDTTVKVDQKNDSENKENPTENDEVKVDE
ncbi:MAG: AAA family ATPase [Bacteroidales bacterium]|nr:AAA family ATPase [Bacteroidales bacterium]